MNLKKYLILAFAALASCANPQPPSGGPPDTTPPRVAEFSPQRGTTDFSGDGVRIEFSEWVNKNSVIENLHIQPEVKSDYDWSGAELEIEFEEPLAENTTYLVMIGGGYQDLKGNNPEEAFAIIFSTGATLDSGKIAGRVFGDEISGADVFAYKIDAIDPDTLNPMHTPPDYFIRCGSSGKYQLLALRDGLYRLFALTDKFRNRLFDPGQDNFGAASRDIRVANGRAPQCDIKLGPAPDMTGPAIYEATGMTRRSTEIMFSEAVDPQTISAESFAAEDSLGNSAQVAGAMRHPEDANKAVVYFRRELIPDMKYTINAARSGEYAIADSAGNPLQDTAASAMFIAQSAADTIAVGVYMSSVADSAKGITPEANISLLFTKPIELTNDTLVSLYNASASISQPVSSEIISGNILEVRPAGAMKYNSRYRLSADLSSVSGIYGGAPADSVFSLEFFTTDNRQFGGASGLIRDSAFACANLALNAVDASGARYPAEIDSAGRWEIRNLPEGNYYFEVYCDGNANGEYDYGWPAPFRHSEAFRIMKTEIAIKARWDVEDILLIVR